MKEEMRNEYIKQIHKEIQCCNDIALLDLIFQLLKKTNNTEK